MTDEELARSFNLKDEGVKALEQKLKNKKERWT